MNPLDGALSQEAAERVQAELRSGEVLHWVGKAGQVDIAALVGGYFFALAWMAFVLLIAYVIYSETALGRGIWGVMVPISLLGLLFNYRLIHKTGRTVYMVTNHRVAWIVLHRKRVLSLALTASVIHGTVMRRGGHGDIVFTHDTDGHAENIFRNIPNVRRVAALINDLAAGR